MSPTPLCESVWNKGVPLLILLLLRTTLLNVLSLSVSTSVVTILPLELGPPFLRLRDLLRPREQSGTTHLVFREAE